jgi:hypothetical protein
MLRQLLERIEYFKSRTPEIAIVAGGDREPMPPCRGRDLTVINGHPLAGFVEEPLLGSPHVRHRNIEAVDWSLECVHKPREPRLKSLTLAPVLGAHPVCQLGDNNCAGITAVLIFLEPVGPIFRQAHGDSITHLPGWIGGQLA